MTPEQMEHERLLQDIYNAAQNTANEVVYRLVKEQPCDSTDVATAGANEIQAQEVKHSLLPWRVSMSGYSIKAVDDDMPIVAQNPWGVRMKEKDIPRWIENAEFIVECVNSHDSLLAQRDALKAALQQLVEHGAFPADAEAVALAAIAFAEAK